MTNETIMDILREMGSIAKRAEYPALTKVIVEHYAERLAFAYNRDLQKQKQMISDIKEALNGND